MVNIKQNFQRDEALGNIDRKINILESWVNNGVPFKTSNKTDFYADINGNKVFDFVPTTVRQFNYWDASQNCEDTRESLPKIRSNNNSTLVRYPDRLARVKSAISDLSAKMVEQTELPPQKKINKYENQITELNQNLKSALIENQRLLLEIRELKDQSTQTKRSLDSIKSELSSQIKSLQNHNSALEAEKRDLVIALSKVRPLKGGDN